MSKPRGAGTKVFRLAEPLTLESGVTLASVDVAYKTWGRLDPDGANAVVICHALTGSADAESWWPSFVSEGGPLDPSRDFVICTNVLGSCYGSTGPSSRRSDGGRWGSSFPDVTVRDMVMAQRRLLDELGVRKVRTVIGGSMGGMQALEWALLDPERVESLVVLASSGRHSAWCIGWSEAQRQAIYADPAFLGGWYHAECPPTRGLALARMIAMNTYRHPQSFRDRFGRTRREDDTFEIASYLRYQGRKLVDRFDANSYITLTKAMDSHDIGRGRGSYAEALASIEQPALVAAVDSDLLYPPMEQEELVEGIPAAELVRITSPDGHDAFLIETEILAAKVIEFRRRVEAEDTDGRLPVAGSAG